MRYILLISFAWSLMIIGSCADVESEAAEDYSDSNDEELGKSPEERGLNQPCGTNETYSTCVNGECFGATYCSEKGTPVKCVKDPKHCYQGCICKKGYLRNDNTGTCVLEAECPASCGRDINARPGCGTNCHRHCSDYKYYQDTGTYRPCEAYCLVGGCDCKPGFLFDDVVGKCVAPVDCAKCPGPNEIYDLCPTSAPQTCISLTRNETCTETTKCVPACRCREGHLRNEYGICVPESECQCHWDPNAVRGCGNNCGRWCKDIDAVEPVLCTAVCCENGCECKKGYYYDEIIGKCVLQSECSRYKCGLHEVYVPCPGCLPHACLTFQDYHCPVIPPNQCKPQCICAPGYIRNVLGNCIRVEDYIRCSGPNEYFTCGGACDNVCATLGIQNITNCPIQNVKCNEMCYCKPGFARNGYGTCVPIPECPQEECHGANEHRDPCPPRCAPETCISIGRELECPIGPAVCIPACRCDQGYFRDQDGHCILEQDCQKVPCNYNTTCNGDVNAVRGCGNNCGRLCSNYNSVEPIFCTLQCDINGCDCKKGYVLDEVIGKCVHPKECTRYRK